MVESIKVTVDVELSIDTISDVFACMGSEDQAMFFALAWEQMGLRCGDSVYREKQFYFIREALAKYPKAQEFLAELREPETDRKKIALEYRQWDLAGSTALEDIRNYKMKMANCRCVPLDEPTKSLGEPGATFMNYGDYTLMEMRTIAARELGPNCIQLFDPDSTNHYFAESASSGGQVVRFFKGRAEKQQTSIFGIITSWESDSEGNQSVSIRKFSQGAPVVHMNIVHESLQGTPCTQLSQRLCCDTPEGATHKHDCTRKCSQCGSFACVEYGNNMCINSTKDIGNPCPACGAKPYDRHDEKCSTWIDYCNNAAAKRDPGDCYINAESIANYEPTITKSKTLGSSEMFDFSAVAEAGTPAVCPDCDGTGKVELFNSVAKCERCQK